ncbi:MAG: HAD family hydrolase [Spirochaetia bacterium]|nr:HAD family hydrolase [Spirochaetia bacterium]
MKHAERDQPRVAPVPPDPAELDALVALFRARAIPVEPLPPPALPAALSELSGRPLPRRPRAILFDVYGTLLASDSGEVGVRRAPGAVAAPREARSDRRRRLDAALARFGVTLGPEEFESEFDRIVRRVHAEGRSRGLVQPEVDAPAVVAEITGFDARRARELCVERECAVNPAQAMPGAADLIARARTEGLALGLVSNAQFYTPLALEAAFRATLDGLGFDPRLRVLSHELGAAKPDRAPYVLAAALLAEKGIEPGDAVMVGNDLANDVAPARELGFMTALFAGDGRSLKLGGGPPPRGERAMPSARPPRDEVAARAGAGEAPLPVLPDTVLPDFGSAARRALLGLDEN